ncbi:MAG: DUF2927 domain-containing protein [Eubacteriales bacterium]|jgi:hypothetical protein|nr:DUF2927 domain-containing protein [Eubacteriales bacterium]MDD3571783.1 DUF2927 domain-containing protein [Eubacteriales bacterium]
MKKSFAVILVVMIMLSGFSVAAAQTAEEAHFREVFQAAAFSTEYGDSEGGKLHRWSSPIVIWAGGEMTREDEEGLDLFIGQLNTRVGGLPPVYRTGFREEANVTVVYAPLERLNEHSKFYVEGNWGFFSFWWNALQEISRAEIAIASDVTSQEERNHLLMEELTGSLGLTNDIDSDPDSIIHQGWTTTQELSDLDWRLLNQLYDDRLAPGMTFEKASLALGWGNPSSNNGLRVGSSGQEVLNMKQRFYELGYFRTNQFNNRFTDNTEETVRLFEKNNGLPVDGVADAQMLSVLFSDDAVKK